MREMLLGELKAQLSTSRDEYRRRIAKGDFPPGKHMPELVAAILWIRQTEARLEASGRMAKQLLSDLVNTLFLFCPI